MTNQQITLIIRPIGQVKSEDFQDTKVKIPPIKEGKFLIQTNSFLWIPYSKAQKVAIKCLHNSSFSFLLHQL